MVLSVVMGTNLTAALAHVGRLRNIEPHKVLGRNQELANWAHERAAQDRLPKMEVAIPVRLMCSEQPGSAWHAKPEGMLAESPRPLCRWRQSQSGRRQFFQGQLLEAASSHEALVHDRPFCKACVGLLPPRARAALQHSSISYR